MLVAHLSRTLGAGDAVTVALPWTLQVPSVGRDRISSFRGGLRLGSFFPILSWDPDRGWVTDPAARLLAESSTTPTADFDVRVRVPPGTRAVVTGDPVGRGVWRARAVRDVAVAVGHFRIRTMTAHVPHPVTVRLAYTTPTPISPSSVIRTAKTTLERMSRHYGAYPWRNYTVVMPRGLGRLGIEYPTLSYVGYPWTTLILHHETGHQWFYSLVGNDQYTDPWLDETLATWSQLRAGSAERVPRMVAKHVGEPMSYWDSHRRRYYFEVYGGGALALRSLGSAGRVDCALRLYVARNAYRIARPGDLLDALNAVIPGAEEKLRRFGIHR
jgi:hypothetical protein